MGDGGAVNRNALQPSAVASAALVRIATGHDHGSRCPPIGKSEIESINEKRLRNLRSVKSSVPRKRDSQPPNAKQYVLPATGGLSLATEPYIKDAARLTPV